jgi:hypothetical protein
LLLNLKFLRSLSSLLCLCTGLLDQLLCCVNLLDLLLLSQRARRSLPRGLHQLLTSGVHQLRQSPVPYVCFSPPSLSTPSLFPCFLCIKALYIDTDGTWYIGNNGKREGVGAKSHIRQSASPNKMPEKCVEIEVSRKLWYLGHLTIFRKNSFGFGKRDGQATFPFN